jgi:hypothetical protein
VIVLFLVAVVAILLFVAHGTGRKATEAALANAYVVRDASGLMLAKYSEAFDTQSGIRAVAEYASGAEAKTIAKTLDEATRVAAAPSLFAPKQRLEELGLAAAQYAHLVREPRGTWLTFQSEVAGLRTKLDGAILAIERELGDDARRKEVVTAAQKRVDAMAAAVAEAAARAMNEELKELEERQKREKEDRDQRTAADAARFAKLIATPTPVPPEEAARLAAEREKQAASFAAAKGRRAANRENVKLVVRNVKFTPHIAGGPFRVKATLANVGPVAACNVRLEANAVGTNGKSWTHITRVEPGGESETPVGWLISVADGFTLKGMDVRVAEYDGCE